MDQKLKQQKIEMWAKKQAEMEKELAVVMLKRGEAAREGDLRENAAYIDFSEQAEVLSARIKDVQKMISQLEKGENEKGSR